MDIIFSGLQTALQQVLNGALDACSDGVIVGWEQQLTNITTSCLSSMRRTRNSRVPINRLPCEIVAQIFFELSRNRPNRRWSSFLQVCHHWRVMALTTPSLWTIIDASVSKPLLEVFLQRSGSMPLSVHYRSQIEAAVFCNMLNNHARRIRSLVVSGPNSSSVVTKLHSSLTQLEVLDFADGDELVGPSDNGHLPKLHTLRARSTCFEGIGHFIRFLRVLKLEGTETHVFPFSMEYLEACPLLEHLIIRDCLPVMPASYIRIMTGPVVTLAKLKRLEIDDSCAVEIRLLCSHLVLPPDAVVILKLSFSEPPPVVPNIFPENPTYWPALSTAQDLKVLIKPNEIVVRLESSIHALPAVVASFAMEDNFYAIPMLSQILAHCATSFASQKIIRLCVKEVSPFGFIGAWVELDDGLWPRVFASFPALSSLRLGCMTDAKPFFEALGDSAETSDALPLAELRRLIFDGYVDAAARNALEDVLRLRSSRGNKLPVLSLAGRSKGFDVSKSASIARKYVGDLILGEGWSSET